MEVVEREVIGWHKRPSIFMPRWASRIDLEITAVRVERAQDITEEDARAEGMDDESYADFREWAEGCAPTGSRIDGLKDCFARLRDSIHGPGAWDANPWVWVISFKRVK
jgi:hypothetical protein